MDLSSQISFERAWAKANRLPQEERAIAPTGQVAYAHGVAEGEAENKAEGFAMDMAAREASQEEQGRQFGLSTGEKGRQVTTSLESRYRQAIQNLDEQARRFGQNIEWTGTRTGKVLGEQERQFSGRLAASASQFDRALAAKADIVGSRLAESSYESTMAANQKMTQFEQELAFKSKKFDDEMAWARDKFSQTMSFTDQVFADKMNRQRNDLDTWIQNNRIGAVIQLANTAVSAYGMGKAISDRKAMASENAALRTQAGLAETAAEINRQRVWGIEDVPTYDYDPDWLKNGKFTLQYDETTQTYEPVPLTNQNQGITDWKKAQIRNNVFNPTTWASFMR
jgi:hypothetical protein